MAGRDAVRWNRTLISTCLLLFAQPPAICRGQHDAELPGRWLRSDVAQPPSARPVSIDSPLLDDFSKATSLDEHVCCPSALGSCLPYGYGDPNYPGRHVGLGQPLVGTSWLNRPHHADVFVGGLLGDDLISNRVDQRGAIWSGFRVGWDLDHFWGVETRLGSARPSLHGGGHSTVQMFDAHLLYYPWGDASWRPYASVGSGIARYSFVDELGQSTREVLYQLPVGIGVKYLFQRWLALRIELMDNIAFGDSELNTINNLSVSGGLEWHFGGRRKSFFPFDPDIHLW